MFANLRHAIARAIAPKAPPPAVVPSPKKRRYPHLARALLQAANAAPKGDETYSHPKRPEGNELGKFPELFPGVLPKELPAAAVIAMDGSGYQMGMDIVLPGEVKRTALALDANPFAPSWGFSGNSVGYGNGFWFPGYPYLAELTQISEYRAPCETIATEMTRKWFEIQSRDGATKKPEDAAEAEGQTDKGDKTEKIAQIMARFEELKVRELFKCAALLDAEFGRAQIYLNIDDADERVRQLPLELTPESIKKGSLKSIACIEPYWSTPYSWNSMYPERSDFYKPTSWYVMGRKTHSTRLLTFIGREVPDLLKPAYNFSGISMIQLGELTVNMWLRTRKAVNDLINNFSIPVLHTDLAATLEEGAEEGSGLMPRLQAFTLTRNNQSIAAINKDTELLEFAEATLASLDKLQAQSQEHMAAVWKLPLIKIFGLAPAGLGATGEGEIQVHYDNVNSMQVSLYGPNLDALLKVVQLDLFGAIDDDLAVHWITLDEPTQKELSEIRKSDADMDASNINSGIISPEEARDRLKSDPDSGYTDLTGNAPEPPEPEGAPGEGGEGDNPEPESMGIDAAFDESNFEESKHKRADNGEFGSGGGGASEKPKGAKLTANEKSTLASYSGDDFLRLNKALREDDDSDPAIARLDSAIGKGSIAEGTTLYRGMTREAAKKLFEGSTITKGADISDKAFASTTKSQGEAGARGMGGVVLKIVAGKNAKGLDMTEHSDNKAEQEVLLPRNAKMKVTGITAPKSLGGHVIVHAVYGNDDDEDGK